MSQSCGQSIAGKIMLFFGALMQLVAAFGYIFSLGLGVIWLLSDTTITSFLIVVFSSLVLHLAGLVMIYSGDYMLGKTKAMSEKELLCVCGLRIARDGCHALSALLFLLAATAFASGLLMPTMVMGVLFFCCCISLWQVNKSLKKMSQCANK